MDSGAGQSVFGSEEAFISESLRSCDIEVEGIAGTIAITSVGTVRLLAIEDCGRPIVCLFHNVLKSSGEHNLLSVSQIHTCGHHVDLHNGAPTMSGRSWLSSNAVRTRRNPRYDFKIPLLLQDGLYVFPGMALSSSDPRIDRSRILFTMTPPGLFVPVQSSSWKCKVLMAPVAALPMAFGEELSRLSSTYVAPASIPASRRRHCPGL